MISMDNYSSGIMDNHQDGCKYLDFDCTETDLENIYYDIYGSDAEPEICLD